MATRVSFTEARRCVARIAVVATVLLLAPTLPQAQAQEADQVRVTDEQRISDRLIELTVETPAFTTPTGVHVNLPVGYDLDPDRRWPVAYYAGGTNSTYRGFNEGLDGEALSAAFPGIVVSPNGDSGYWSDWFNAGAGGPPQYETWVIDQLIPLVDGRFRTIADRSGRAVLGVSMGGYGAIMFAARHPDLFTAAASISGAVDSNLVANGAALSASPALQGAEPDAIYGPRATQEIRWRGHNPVDLAANLRNVDVLLSSSDGTPNPDFAGSEDAFGCVLEQGVQMATVSLHDRLVALDIPHGFTNFGPGCHSAPSFIPQVAAAFARFTEVFGAAMSAPATFEHRAIEPVVDVWGWRVEADPERSLEFLHLQGVSVDGLTLVGSGRTTVTTPTLFTGASQVAVTGAEPMLATPDATGRITVTVDLGPANQTQALTPGAANPATTQTVTFTPMTVDSAPDADSAPTTTTAPPTSTPTPVTPAAGSLATVASSAGALPATGPSLAPSLLGLLLIGAAMRLSRRHAHGQQ